MSTAEPTPAAPSSEFQPANTLRSRTFIGLLVAQFLAAFNDQAIHASAMFFAFKTRALNEAEAISLMPILFYAPWAIFCTMAGYYADKYSKTYSLVFWKLAEVGITGVALFGFYIGTHGSPTLGTWIVLSTVFLMGTHSAFFVPAKYGVMPEILQPHLLSRGNGLLESLSFLAVILGTVFGGVLSVYFERREEYIGVVLVGLAIIGALASMLIRTMPAAAPHTPFPAYIFGPLIKNLKILFSVKALRLTVIGIAFFTFVVAFMRQTVYMLGESQNPRWDEALTSMIVGTVALGIGVGSPLAGWLSGRKVELGLIPIGGIGMICGAVLAALTLDYLPGLIVCIVLIGFNTGFYLVPMYTLLQYRAPKSSKGNMIATSNFINVTGAIASSLLFFVLVTSAKQTGFVPEVEVNEVATGNLDNWHLEHGRPVGFVVSIPGEDGKAGSILSIGKLPKTAEPKVEEISLEKLNPFEGKVGTKGLTIHTSRKVEKGQPVVVSGYNLRGVEHYLLRQPDEKPEPAYDLHQLPQFLFLGTGAMTLFILIILLFSLRDMLSRSVWFLRTVFKPMVRVDLLKNLPGTGRIILVTNAQETDRHRSIIAATDRYTRFFHESELNTKTADEAIRVLENGDIIGVSVAKETESDAFHKFIEQIQVGLKQKAEFVPVYCGIATMSKKHDKKVLRVVFGEKLEPSTDLAVLGRRIDLMQNTPMD